VILQRTFSTAYNTFVLVIAEAALIADANKGCWPNVGIANWALSVALVAETADGNPRLLPAHDEIRMMARHLMSGDGLVVCV
jgi:hypothetical protein